MIRFEKGLRDLVPTELRGTVEGRLGPLLVEAEAVQPAGPAHREQVTGLAALLETAAVPVRVRLLSDDATEVTVYHVGELGTFLSHELDLRPGTYTVVGSRPGYRDVRKELVVAPGAQQQSLSIQCEETI